MDVLSFSGVVWLEGDRMWAQATSTFAGKILLFPRRVSCIWRIAHLVHISTVPGLPFCAPRMLNATHAGQKSLSFHQEGKAAERRNIYLASAGSNWLEVQRTETLMAQFSLTKMFFAQPDITTKRKQPPAFPS